MNFFPNMPNFNDGNNGFGNMQMMDNQFVYKIKELENRIKKLEQRIARLESDKGYNNYLEPDNSLYMI